MSEQKNPPAFLISKNDESLLESLEAEEGFALFKAIFAYATRNELPNNFSKHLQACFHCFRKTIDIDVDSWRLTCERKKRSRDKAKQELELARKIIAEQRAKPAQSTTPAEPSEAKAEDKPKPRGKPPREPTDKKTATGEVVQDGLTPAQTRFLASFKTHCPDKVINCKLADFPDIDLEALMIAIKQSPQFLMKKNKNETLNGLRWYLENADKILNNNYVKYGDEKPKPQGVQHNYTKEEMNALFQNIEEIEF